MSGYALTDSLEDLDKDLLPDITIPSGGYLIVYASDTMGQAGDVFSIGFKLSKKGETLFLLNKNAVCIQTLTVPALNDDESYAMRKDGTYGYCCIATPGKPNDDNAIATEQPTAIPNEDSDSKKADLQKKDPPFDSDGVYTSEVCAANAAKSDLNDWIELYNGSDEAVDLKGYALSDDENVPQKWVFPSIRMEPFGYVVIEASSDNSECDEKTACFGLSPQGETLYLYNVQGQLVDRIPYRCSSIRRDKRQNCGRYHGAASLFRCPHKGKAECLAAVCWLCGVPSLFRQLAVPFRCISAYNYLHDAEFHHLFHNRWLDSVKIIQALYRSDCREQQYCQYEP